MHEERAVSGERGLWMARQIDAPREKFLVATQELAVID
jgi:hypothetical protein